MSRAVFWWYCFFVRIIPHLIWEIKCVMASGVCEGKERTFLTLDLSFYSCGKIDLILEDIPFVSICSYMLVISKDSRQAMLFLV